ncbi:helix-turn-helix domain-containing protein [Microbacterium sp. LMI1x-1-1.1]|uniref:helix-turn-helix domain-containing protein n=1 Tax=Microbacterium sp. LMI1x-1-1.1 TaxID=3135246 RepID=UPI0034404B39
MSRDVQIGQNLARLRGSISQSELAAQMKALGWKWSQSTVWSIEKGDRPLRLAEAEDLLPILNLSNVHQIIGSAFERDMADMVDRVRKLRDSAIRAIHSYNHARLDLAIAADDHDLGVTEHHEVLQEVRVGPIELAETYEVWAVNVAEGDTPVDRSNPYPLSAPDPAEPGSMLNFYMRTTGYRGDRG